MSLSSIQTGITPRPFRLIIHGMEKIGKSTFAASSPEPIFIQTEDGLDQIDVPKFPLCETFDAVLVNLRALLNEHHEYQTLVLDSVDWLEKLIVSKILLDTAKSTLSEVGSHGAGYLLIESHFKQVMTLLNLLRNKKEMNIILVAHTKMEKVEDPGGTSYDQFAPRLDKRVNGIIKEWSDVIGFATHKIRREELKEGFGKRTVAKTIKEKDGNDRVFILKSSPTVVAGSRYSLPSEMPLDGESFFLKLWSVIHPEG